MSQIYKSSASGPQPPTDLTKLIADNVDNTVTAIVQTAATAVIPTANAIQLNGDNGIETDACPNVVGSTNVLQIRFSRGIGQTVGATTTTILTLGTRTNTCVTLKILVTGLSTDNLGVGGYAIATYKNIAGVVSIVDVLDFVVNSDAGLAGATFGISVSGTNLTITATGVAGKTINWTICTPGIVST